MARKDDKLLNLKDGRVLYNDLRDRIEQKMPIYELNDPVVRLEETTLNFSKDGDNDWYIADLTGISIDVPRGTEMIYSGYVYVTFDDTEYTCYLEPFSYEYNGDLYNSYFVGSGTAVGAASVRNLPFTYARSILGAAERLIAYSTDATHKVKIVTQTIKNKADFPKRLFQDYNEPDINALVKSGAGVASIIIGGNGYKASGRGSVCFGYNQATGDYSTACGYKNIASGIESVASGAGNTASGQISRAVGSQCTASETLAEASGYGTTASGYCANASGYGTVASGARSHAEGNSSVASGDRAHAEGHINTASGRNSHAENARNVASGLSSHAQGYYTIANHAYQHAAGAYNVPDDSVETADEKGNYAEIIGNGTSEVLRSNARTLDWSGNERLAGDVYVGCNADSSGGTKLPVVDDTAGAGDTDKVWSADKSAGEVSDLLSAIDYITPADYSASATYAVGDLCWHEGKMYRCSTAIETAEAWTAAHWTEIRFPLDVRVNGTSVVTDGVANVPLGGPEKLGVFKCSNPRGITASNGYLGFYNPTSNEIKSGTSTTYRSSIRQQHEAAFYGLAKSAGDTTQRESSNAVGTYTDSAKSAISQMLNAPETVSGSTPSITAKAGIQYICGECSTLDITLPASGCIDVVFESGSTATVLTITPPTGMTVEWANGFDSTALEADTLYELNIKMVGTKCLGVAGAWT